ncbi:hypothetical protein ACLUEY_12085 [Vreelandella aquamarina]
MASLPNHAACLMLTHQTDSVYLYDVVFIILPRLQNAQTLVNKTLNTLIDGAKDPKDLLKRLEQKRKFTLETQSIRVNLEHLLERYRSDVDSLLQSQGANGNREVLMDEMERDAIARAKEIYRKVVAFQTGRREVPF